MSNKPSQTPTNLGATALDEAEVVPTLAQIGHALPVMSTQHLISGQLAKGHTPDAVVGSVAILLGKIIPWRDFGVPSGRLGPQGEGLLRDVLRVFVDVVERRRQVPSRSSPNATTIQRQPPPYRGATRTVTPQTEDPIALEPDPGEGK